MHHNFLALLSFLNLLHFGKLANTRGYFWRFKVQETYVLGQTSITSLIGTADCSPKLCQTAIDMPTTPRSTASLRAYACPFFTNPRLPQTGSTIYQDYGGCPYWSCKIHWVRLSKGPHNQFHLYVGENRTAILHIPDPWHIRWVQGEQAKIYARGDSSRPSATIEISRE